MVVLILYNNKISLIRGVTLDILKTVQTNLMIKSRHKQEDSNIADLLAANIFSMNMNMTFNSGLRFCLFEISFVLDKVKRGMMATEN